MAFSLFYGCYEYMTRKEELHVLIVGLDRAGKTTILERLKTLYTAFPGLEPNQVVPTVGLNIGRFEVYKTPLVFWDLGGQAGLRTIWDKYYGDSHAIVFVVDSSDGPRIDEARHVLDKLMSSKDLTGAPLLVLANKQDAPRALAAIELKERLGLNKYSNHACDVQPCSSMTGDGLKNAIDWLINQIKSKRSRQRTEMLRRKTLG